MVVGAVMCAGCQGDRRRAGAGSSAEELPTPSEACVQAWSEEAARAFVSLLTDATKAPVPVWQEYDLADGAYVLNAGSSAFGGACLGAWRAGKALGFAELAEAPTLSTPLYGYSLPEGDYEDFGSNLGSQPPSVRAWLADLDVVRATALPVTVPDFPIELTPLVKVQLAIHEGFHVEVQSPHWTGAQAHWPAWDRQPDRKAVVSCYAETPDVEEAAAGERGALLEHVQALLDGDEQRACQAGADFLAWRASRRDLVAGVTVPRHDGTPGTCGEAEAIMELEEGVADYASWTKLFELGLASRDRLVGRYAAQQSDLYYLTGAMELHAVSLMAPEHILDITEEIARSAGPGDGSLEVAFTRALEAYCGG